MKSISGLIKKIFTGKNETGITVQQVIGALPEAYIVFSSVFYNHSGIDHVVFSRRQGVFVVNGAADKGNITYDGTQLQINNKPQSTPIKKTLKDTFWLKSTIRERIGLDVPVTPIVVFERAGVQVSQPVAGVLVMGIGDLAGAILNAPEKKVLEDGVLAVLRELHGIHTISYRNL